MKVKGVALLVGMLAMPAWASDVAGTTGLAWWDSWMLWLQQTQAQYHRELVGAARQLARGGEGSLLWGLAFMYGVFHAAGPGHGKAVIASYLLAEPSRLRQGVSLAFISALAQALTAILLVGLVAGLLKGAAKVTQYTQLLEQASYLAIAVMGLWLGWRVWRGHQCQHDHSGLAHHHGEGAAHTHSEVAEAQPRFALLADGGHAHSCAHTPHVHGPGCHHHSHLSPPVVQPAPAQQGWSAQHSGMIASIGLRPCSGAILLLVFALAQGIFWQGVVGVVIMAFGTALTVASLAVLTVVARDFSHWLAARQGGQVSLWWGRVLGTLAAATLVFLALSLFISSLSAPALLR